MDPPNSKISTLSNTTITQGLLKGGTGSSTTSSNNTFLIISGVSLAIALGSLFYEKIPKKYKNYQYGLIVVLLVITFYLFLNKDKFAADSASSSINEEILIFNGSNTVLTLSNGTVLKKGEKWVGIPGPNFEIKETKNKTIVNDNIHVGFIYDNYTTTVVTPDKPNGTLDLILLSMDSPQGRLIATSEYSTMKLTDPNAELDCSMEIKGMKWGTTACAPLGTTAANYVNLSEDLQSTELINTSSLEFIFYKAKFVYYGPNGETGNVQFNWPNADGYQKFNLVKTGEVLARLPAKEGIFIQTPEFFRNYNNQYPEEILRADPSKFNTTVTENYDNEWAKKTTLNWNNKKGVFIKEVTNDTVKFKRIFGLFPIEIS